VLEYDDVMNTQRTIIYEQRRKVLDGDNIKPVVQAMIGEVIETAVLSAAAEHDQLKNQTDLDEVVKPYEQLFLKKKDVPSVSDNMSPAELKDYLNEKAIEAYEAKEEELGLLRHRNATHARTGARHYAARRRRILDGAYRRHGGASRRRSPARLRPDQSRRRI
jgi:preprotein translocase subunit SecA